MPAITISPQLGSGGATVARLVAQHLGFRLLDRELVEAVAARAGVSVEIAQSLDDAHLDLVTDTLNSLHLDLEGKRISQQSYQYIAACLIREAAEREAVVVVGRAGQVVLGRRPGIFHVKVIAPFEERVARIARRERVSTKEARRRVSESDEGRRLYVWSASGRDCWDDPVLYDLVVNTSRVGIETAARMIAEAAPAVLEAPGVAARPADAGQPGEESSPPHTIGRRAR